MTTVISRDHLIGSVPVGNCQRKGYQASRAAEHSAVRRVSGQTSATNAWNQNWNSSNLLIGLLYNNISDPVKGKSMFIKPVPRVEFLHECFDYNSDTGALTWRKRPRDHFLTESKWKRHLSTGPGKEAGTLNVHGYRVVRLTYEGSAKLYPAHRIIWALLHGRDASVIDHINGNRSDNRAANLREISQSDNVRKKQAVKVGLRGAHYDKSRGKWLAQIRINGRQVFLGRFDTEKEAHAAYQKRLQQLNDARFPTMKHIKFTYNRNFRIKPGSIQLSESEKDSAYLQFRATGLDASEWLTWFAQYSDEYIKAALPTCKKCGGSVHHSESLIQRGNHGSDPLVNHVIECQDCGVVYADYTGYPGVTLDTIQKLVEGN